MTDDNSKLEFINQSTALSMRQTNDIFIMEISFNICKACTCCNRHMKDRPADLFQPDPVSLMVSICKPIETEINTCNCYCRNTMRELWRICHPKECEIHNNKILNNEKVV